MSSFLKLIKTEDLPLIRAMLNFVSALLLISLLILLSVKIGIYVPVLFVGVFYAILIFFESYFEDIKGDEHQYFKFAIPISILKYISLLSIMFILYFLMKSSAFLAISFVCFFIFFSIQTFLYPQSHYKLINILKDAVNTKDEEVEGLQKKSMKVFLNAIVTLVISLFYGISFLCFFISSLQLVGYSTKSILYFIFVYVATSIIANFIKKIKKEYLNRKFVYGK